jgi:twitching motility two-component system response regulator PilH
MAKILVVDDSPTQLTNLVRIVEAHGHTTVTATNGLEGVSMAKAELPDLVLMDVVMPELNGFQATRKITKDPSTQHIPVVIVTTKDQQTDRVWGERQGASAYIVKPAQEQEVMETVNSLLG